MWFSIISLRTITCKDISSVSVVSVYSLPAEPSSSSAGLFRLPHLPFSVHLHFPRPEPQRHVVEGWARWSLLEETDALWDFFLDNHTHCKYNTSVCFLIIRFDLVLSLKVMQVVREQITRTLSSKPTSLELFKNKVNALNYSEILKLRQTERLHQEETLSPPVL